VPIYEYQCADCAATFEELVRSPDAAPEVTCPGCGSTDVARRPSVFSAHQAPARTSGPAGGCGQCCSQDGACPWAES
jgi:putative FmdB family regulatory protein